LPNEIAFLRLKDAANKVGTSDAAILAALISG